MTGLYEEFAGVIGDELSATDGPGVTFSYTFASGTELTDCRGVFNDLAQEHLENADGSQSVRMAKLVATDSRLTGLSLSDKITITGIVWEVYAIRSRMAGLVELDLIRYEIREAANRNIRMVRDANRRLM